MPNGLIDEYSLRTHPDGLALALTLPWYRSLWLSSVSTLRLTRRRRARSPPRTWRSSCDGVRYALDELPEQSDVLWYLQEHPLLIVARRDPVALGETHEVELVGELRLPYMQIAPGQDGGPGMYVPNFVNQTLTLTVDRSGCRASGARRRDVPPPPPADRGGPVQARAHALLGECRVPRRLVRLRRPARPGRRARHRPRHRDRRLAGAADVSRSCRTSSSRNWRAAFDRHGFDASSFGANLDMGRRRDRDMTPDEEFEFSETLFRGAKKLGFPLVRIQSAKPELLRRLLPVAEELELKLAYEIHAPHGAERARRSLKVRDVYAELDSPLLGFVADFSSTMHSMSPTLLRAVRRAGLDDDAVAEAAGDLGDGCPDAASARRSSSATCEAATSTRAASAPSPTSRSTCTATSTRRSGPTSCRRSCTCTRSSTTSTRTARSRRSTTPSSCACSSRAATAATGPASGRATPSPSSARWTRWCSSASSTTSSATACGSCSRHEGRARGGGHMPHVTAGTNVAARLERSGDVTQLVVHGRTTLLIGGQVHNSTSSHPDSIARAFAHAADIGSNTVFAPVDWACLEPEEGRFDFGLVDAMLAEARRRGLMWVPLWFGAFKNAHSTYAPELGTCGHGAVPSSGGERDRRGPRSPTRARCERPTLSVFGEELREADAARLRCIHASPRRDGDRRAVPVVQVENEVGLLADSRDRSPLAEAEWQREVPESAAAPPGVGPGSGVRGVVAVGGAGPTRARHWQELFGAEWEADEVFMAWAFGSYVEAVAAPRGRGSPDPASTSTHGSGRSQAKSRRARTRAAVRVGG